MVNNDAKIETILEMFYGIISGKTSEPRDWVKFKNLFLEKAVLSICKKDARGCIGISSFSVDEYMESLKPFLAAWDFFEYPVSNELQIFGEICCICNEYAAYGDDRREVFIKRGRNLVNMAFDGTGWKIAGMLWEDGV